MAGALGNGSFILVRTMYRHNAVPRCMEGGPPLLPQSLLPATRQPLAVNVRVPRGVGGGPNPVAPMAWPVQRRLPVLVLDTPRKGLHCLLMGKLGAD